LLTILGFAHRGLTRFQEGKNAEGENRARRPPFVATPGIENQSINFSQAIINPLVFQSPRMNISQE
jgi:hypothetical protein